MLKIAGIQMESVVDGYGIRNTIFTQGCPHHCKGCHNPETWTFEGGIDFDEEKQMKFIESCKQNPLIDGITLSGGDPIAQAHDVLEFVQRYKKELPNHTIWLYTGYTYNELVNMYSHSITNLLELIDVLVDGKFVLEKKSLDVVFRGSTNQRLIDMKKTTPGNIVLLEESSL